MEHFDVNNFDAIKINLASPMDIEEWSHGEVTKPETINYRTQKPEKEGLFCERIFGPSKDWECSCGKYKKIRYKGIICERCGVEVTRSKVRREWMGHIKLAAPVSHIWYVKGVPSRLGYLLDVSPKELESVLYFSSAIITSVDTEKRAEHMADLKKETADEIASLGREVEERKAELKKMVDFPDSLWEPLLTVNAETGEIVPAVEQTTLVNLVAISGEKFVESGMQLTFKEQMHFDVKSGSTVGSLRKAMNRLMGKELNLVIVRDQQVTIPAAEKGAKPVQHSTIKYELKAELGWEEIEEEIQNLAELFHFFERLEARQVIRNNVFQALRDRYGDYFEGGMGAEAVRELLRNLDIDAEVAVLEEQIETSKGQRRAKAVKRLKVAAAFKNSGNRPEWMILNLIPVIPPDLRPMVQLDGGRFATSDLNDLYRRVINRNSRLKKLLEIDAPEIITNNEKRMLQEAVDALFDNGRRGKAVTGPGNRPLKSLSDMLKGKQGRFRQNLLGKRVDYSGRSVIVVGPELKLHQCGLPKIMALELFKPFVMKRLVEMGEASNIKNAKRMVERMKPKVWDILEEVITEHPVMLNRAPTLHRLGIQAFEPVLVEGKAIQIHPLVCTAFNADFDGDQMAVHVPLSMEAQAEARLLMLSTNNILSPANGRPIVTPSQDMVLGTYFLTFEREKSELTDLIFSGYAEALTAYDQKAYVFRGEKKKMRGLRVHDRVRMRYRGKIMETTMGRIIFNEAIENVIRHYDRELFESGAHEFVDEVVDKKKMAELISSYSKKYDSTLKVYILDKIKDIGFKYATRGGITISKDDIIVPPEKEKILAEAEASVEKIQQQFMDGFITDEERHSLIIDKWNQTTDKVSEAMRTNFDPLNPIYMMANSGARGSFTQIRQLAAMRGLVANPKGEIIDRPIKSNFSEGLSVLEYFISTHGARKGLADTALRTADSGYLTRRLVDVCQDVIIREEDCGDKQGSDSPVAHWKNDELSYNESLIGRSPVGKLVDPVTGEIIDLPAVDGVPLITEDVAMQLFESFASDKKADRENLPAVKVRSPLTCKSKHGVCRSCYGTSLANGRLVDIGEAVGIIAAQSIGEPGTQLTMRTFHTGGVVVEGGDVTHGLPRVVELFEARKPKGRAEIAYVNGRVKVSTADDDPSIEQGSKMVTIVPKDKNAKPDIKVLPHWMRLLVKNGEEVAAGTNLTEGPLDPHEILRVQGIQATQRYLVGQVQEVYTSQGVDIHDKHVELIVRQMMRKVRIEDSGDTDFLPDKYEDRLRVEDANKAVKAEKGRQATYEDTLLGITKASLATDSFLSAASFQETTRVLTEAAIAGKKDELYGLKENVIIGKLIPAATGMRRYRTIELETDNKYEDKLDLLRDYLDQQRAARLHQVTDEDVESLFGIKVSNPEELDTEVAEVLAEDSSVLTGLETTDEETVSLDEVVAAERGKEKEESD